MQRGSWRPVEINNQKQTNNNNKKKPQKLNLAACQNVGIGGVSECRYWRLVQATNTDIAAAAWAATILPDHHDDEERYAI